MSDEIVVHGRLPKDPNALTLIIDGVPFEGWEHVALTVRAEGFPNNFRVSVSTLPGNTIPIKPGNKCVAKLGKDVVLTGWIDRISHRIDDMENLVEISGRGLTQDLVDCGAEWPSHQLINGNALTIATQIASAYGLSVIMGNGADPGPSVPTWALNYGETGADIVQRVTRNAGLLAYENALGQLVLAKAGSAVAASGAVYGENVQRWVVENSIEDRFSDYVCCFNSNAAFFGPASGNGSDTFGTAKDPGVPRHRLHYLVMEPVSQNPQDFVQKRALWEAARRAGRSYVVDALVDSWRDSAGTLWTPNTLIPIKGPGVAAGDQFIIAEVTYLRDIENGTTARIVAMPPTAFTPEPITLLQINTLNLNPVPQGQGTP